MITFEFCFFFSFLQGILMVFSGQGFEVALQVYMSGGRQSFGSVHVSSAKSGSMLGFYVSKFPL